MTDDIGSHHYAIVNGVRLHYVEAGSGPLVVLLHGFPEFWYSWRHQIPALVEAGFRVVAPDLRGYNESEKTYGARSYRVEELTADVAALIRHLGHDKAHIVGHDWGGYLAWLMPAYYPEMVERLVVLNGPHPGAFLRELQTFDQLRRSWYILFFQLPWLPEWIFSAFNYLSLDYVFRTEPAPGVFDEAAIARYKDAFRQPGAMHSAINWYRAAFRRGPGALKRGARAITVPTLLIWGEQDPHLTPRLCDGLEKWVVDLTVERLPEASHWVQHDQPERVNWLLASFLRRP